MSCVTHLRCEYLVNPQGLDETSPRLSWAMESERRGARQTAYRVCVASSAVALAGGEADLWDTGRVESDASTQIAYEGAALGSRMSCHWQVEVWDESGASMTSEPAQWTMGLLEAGEWKAKWITHDPEIVERDAEATAPTMTEPGTPPLLRKEFGVKGKIARAMVYVSGRGLFELRINGAKVGEDIFAPEWTDYDKRIHYRTYDVTEMVREGENAIGAMLGDGWWSGYVGWQETRARYGSLENSLMVQLEVELEGGERVTVGTDGSWKCEAGPILTSDFMMGEHYDARRDRAGWDAAGYDDGAWLEVREVAAPGVPLVAQRSQPVQVVETLTPVSVNEIEPGVFIYDLGQNIAGWVRLRLSGPAGTRVQLRHGERLNPDGTMYTENLRRAKATDTIVLKGAGEEVWEPRFTFHGFQYIELTGLDAPPPEGAVTGCMVMSATPQTGEFECSHPLVNRLWQNALWSQKDNFLTVPTDCPQRDERLGWMGDAQVFSRTASYNMDVAAFFTKWMIDVEDAQTEDGIFPDTAPRLREGENFIGLDMLCGGAGWADAGVIIPFTMWRVYGDRRMLERHWGAMAKWLEYVERTNPRGIRENELNNNYGDWLCIPSDREFRTHSPMKTLLATAYWADDAAKLARIALELGRKEDAKRYLAMFERVREAFQKEWLLEDGKLAVETQTAYLLALAFNLLPEEVRERAAEHLVENIKELDWHLSTGFIGISHLNPILTLAGRADVAYRLLLNEDYPSWLYPVVHGATTIWERWNGWTHEGGFFEPTMNSFNHYSLGSVGEWLYRHVAGIELDAEAPGFQRFVLRPYLGAGLDHARASYRTQFGKIESQWRLDGAGVEWEVRIPANSSAQVWIPAAGGAEVTEGGRALEEAEGLSEVRREGDGAVCRAGAGAYRFRSSRVS